MLLAQLVSSLQNLSIICQTIQTLIKKILTRFNPKFQEDYLKQK